MSAGLPSRMPAMPAVGKMRGLPVRGELSITQELESLSLNAFSFPDAERPAVISSLLEQMTLALGVQKVFGVDEETIANWIGLTSRNYHHVPYHNYHHCFSVTHMAYLMIMKCKLLEKIGQEMCAYLLVSAVCHDLDHPGVSNSCLKLLKDVRIKKYKSSYLENHHYEVSIALLKESGMLSHLTPEKDETVKQVLLDLIIATDLELHGAIMQSFKGISANFDFKNREHVILLLKILLKACDVSNEVRPEKVADEWVKCLFAEFSAEGDKREAHGLEVPPMLSRDASWPDIQRNFLSKLVIPLFDSISKVLPEIDVHFTRQLRQAVARYEAELGEEKSN